MSADEIPQTWSKRFGLAVSPLFEHEDISSPGNHSVFLDGGQGTFALSISDDDVWRDGRSAGWVWSSDIAHHVTVTPTNVAVVRWDNPTDVTLLSRSSVDKNLDDFYRFIATDRVRSTRTVVYHLLNLFRKIRSLAASAKLPDARSSEVFLFSLARLIFEFNQIAAPSEYGIADDVGDLSKKLDQTALSAALAEIQRNVASFLKLYPTLAIRHAGGLLFQEAHFELIRAPSVDFFGHVDAPEVNEVGRGGAHFTPPALARSLVENAIGQLADLPNSAKLTVCDPACGSGVFLHEVLRALRRTQFVGRLTLIGRDISPIAISMARFVLSCAIHDWSPAGGVDLDLQSGDSLESDSMPKADLIVMNPPFISWGSQNQKQRSQLLSIVGRYATARGDLSMAFVLRALESLRPDGVLATLFPASLLSQQAAEKWRERLVNTATVKLLASIGDYGLFTHALVQVACAVLKNSDLQNGRLTALVAGDDAVATGDALRALRQSQSLPPALPIVEQQWSIFSLEAEMLKARPIWRLRPPAVNEALRKLEDSLPRLGSLFDVRQGVQTGYNPALLLSETEWANLPKRERAYFRPATMTDSIKNGEIVHPYYLFFPHTPNGPLFRNEQAVRKAVPEYFQRYLAPNKKRLSSRASIRRSKREDWWGLMEPRSWSVEKTPRIISKYFSGEGGFLADVKAEYLPSTGFAWIPKSILKTGRKADFPIGRLLLAYAALFNTAVFGRLLQYYAPHVSGGQFDLSPRYVDEVPLPNLSDLLADPVRGESITRLGALAEPNHTSSLLAREEKEAIISSLYGPQIISAL
jgi:hypothetical protein